MKNKLIIAPHSFKRELLNIYRKNNVFTDVKIIDKKELIDNIYGKFSHKTIPFVMKLKAIDYQNALKLLEYVRYINTYNANDFKESERTKVSNLYSLRNTLIDEGLLIQSPYFKQELRNKDIEIVGYSILDEEIKTALRGFNYQFVKDPKDVKVNNIIEYKSLDEEVLYTLNRICEIYKSESRLDNIYIFTNNDLAITYLKKYASGFNLPINYNVDDSLINTSIAKEFLNQFLECKDIEIAKDFLIKKYSSKADELISVIESNNIESLSFELQYDLFKNFLRMKKITSSKFDNAVTIINKPILVNNAHVFLIDFTFNNFPKVYADNGYLNDKICKMYNINTSTIKTNIYKDEMIMFLSSTNNFYVSYSKSDYKEKHKVSAWKDDFNLKVLPNRLPNRFYSYEMARFLYGNSKDLLSYYNEMTDELLMFHNALKELFIYNNYDNSFKQFNLFNDNKFIKLSYSSSKNYSQCSFKYFLNNVLYIDKFEDTISTHKGNLAHNVLTMCFEPDFDFDDAFDSYLTNISLSVKDLAMILNYKPILKHIISILKEHYDKYMDNPKQYYETKLEYELNDKAKLTGNVDKIIITNNQDMFIVDYKTGDDVFKVSELKYDRCMQLPTYALLSKNSSKFKDYELSGLYINNISPTNIKDMNHIDGVTPEFLKLSGITLDSGEAIKRFEKNIQDKSNYIKGVTLMGDNSLKKVSSIVSDSEIASYIDIARDYYERVERAIRSNDFSINPKYFNERDNACLYCKFKDICFVKSEQFIKINKKKGESDE